MRLSGVPLGGGRSEGRISLARFAEKRPRAGRVWVASGTITRAALEGWAAAVLSRELADVSPRPPEGVAVVGGLDRDLFLSGEGVVVDGGAGTVELPSVTEVEVVTAFVQRADGRILLLRRSARVGSFQGKWACVSGFLDRASPETQARRELQEEIGFGPDDVALLRGGPVVYARDRDRVFAVHPFLFEARATTPTLDWEHDASVWVRPGELRRRPTVPKLDRVWAALHGPPARRKSYSRLSASNP